MSLELQGFLVHAVDPANFRVKVNSHELQLMFTFENFFKSGHFGNGSMVKFLTLSQVVD